MSRLALITCKVLPEPDPDQDVLTEALAERGVPSDLLPWDDEGRSVSGYAACIPRSCWNYHEHPEAFLAWIERARKSSRLVNPPDVLHWNLHKRYLRELEAAGIPVIPTAWFDRGTPASFEQVCDDRGWSSVVVKPAISAASFRTRRFDRTQSAEGGEFLAELLRERDAMMQPLLKAFEDPGERALVWIDGRLTHAVRKSPRFAGSDEQVSEALPVTPEETEFARAVLDHVKGDLLYARLDVLPDGRGGLLLSELELMEPSLFLLQNPEALDRFADALERLARSS